MYYEEKFNNLVNKNPKEIYKEFLNSLKNLFLDYLSGKVDDVTVSNLTVFWYSTKDKFSDSLVKIDPRIKDLRAAMDITHPDYSTDKKKRVINELIKIIDEILTT